MRYLWKIKKKEAVLVVLTSLQGKENTAYWDEFLELVKAADMEVVMHAKQHMKTVNSATYIGSGKVKEIKEMLESTAVDVVLIDHVLTPLQSRNLEKAWNRPIMDRNALILELFETRAVTAEAKLQIEAAKLNALLPKLVGSTSYLGRQSGGRNKGAGEKQLELDRRVIKRRIGEVRNELKRLEKQRAVRAAKRQRNDLPIVALIGYTNAGKSTIMNQLLDRFQKKTAKQVLEKDMLFATLDTSVRRIALDAHRQFLLIDTVGFVSDLPHELIEAFHSTLEQIKEADLLLQIVDGANPHYREQMQITSDTLQKLGVENIPMLTVFNKADRLQEKHPRCLREDRVMLCAKAEKDIDFLCDLISKRLYPLHQKWKLKIPYDDALLAQLRKQGILSEIHYLDDAMLVEIDADAERMRKWEAYLA